MLCGDVTCCVEMSHVVWRCHMLCGDVTCCVEMSHVVWRWTYKATEFATIKDHRTFVYKQRRSKSTMCGRQTLWS